MEKFFIGIFILLFGVSAYTHAANPSQNHSRISQEQADKTDTITGKKYSRDHLHQASTDELNLCLKKAKGLKTIGIVTTIAGPVLVVTGLVLSAGWIDSGPPIFWAGFITTIAGVPILITGSRRVNKIESELYDREGIGFNISPGILYNNYDQNL